MDPEIIVRLVYSMTQFLRQQVESSNLPNSILKEEGAESVEVALQCLEAAYGVPQESTSLQVDLPLYNIFANAIQGQPKVNLASQSARQTSEEDKSAAEEMKNKGNSLMRDGQYSDALVHYTKAIEKDQNNAVYYSNRAAALSKLERYHDAIADCKRALELDSNYSKAYGRMGLAYSALDKYHEAKECYKKALELEPNNESYKNNLSVAEDKLKSGPQTSNTGMGGINLGPFAQMAGLGGQAPNLGTIFSNPHFMNLATQMMSDPNMQNLMQQFIGSGAGAGAPGATNNQPAPESAGSTPGNSDRNFDMLLNAGRQLAENIESQNPEVVEMFRNQMDRIRNNQRDGNNDNGQPPSS